MKLHSYVGGVEINIDTKRIDENLREAQKLLNLQIVKDSEQFVPFSQGALRSSVEYPEGLYGGEISYNTPYAHYLYEGTVYGPNIPIKDAEGNKLKDLETFASVINNVNGTDAVKTSIASSSNLIGYISLGSLDDTVKALTFKGVEATVANIKAGTYELKRPFNIVYQEGKLSEKAQAFIDFIMSDEGQAIVLEEGYIDMN